MALDPPPSWMYDRYPREISSTTQTLRVERIAYSRTLDEAEAVLHHNGSLWALQQTVAHARFDILNKLLQDDYVPIVGRDWVRVVVEVGREAVPRADTFDGPVALRDGENYVTVRRPLFRSDNW